MNLLVRRLPELPEHLLRLWLVRLGIDMIAEFSVAFYRLLSKRSMEDECYWYYLPI